MRGGLRRVDDALARGGGAHARSRSCGQSARAYPRRARRGGTGCWRRRSAHLRWWRRQLTRYGWQLLPPHLWRELRGRDARRSAARHHRRMGGSAERRHTVDDADRRRLGNEAGSDRGRVSAFDEPPLLPRCKSHRRRVKIGRRHRSLGRRARGGARRVRADWRGRHDLRRRRCARSRPERRLAGAPADHHQRLRANLRAIR